jgi:hypothetical protein
MPSKKQRHRRELFERQWSPLSRFLHADERRWVMCPLCLRLIEEPLMAGPYIEIEHAPPAQYGGGVERCLTCADCNRAAGSAFETRTAMLNEQRDSAIENARPTRRWTTGGLELPSLAPVYLPRSKAVELATVRGDERQLELKGAYLLAFATLGHSFVLGGGLDIVRSLLNGPSEDLDEVQICATTSLPRNRLYVVVEPLRMVVVPHPTKHARFSNETHVVFLPLPDSPADFYDRLALNVQLQAGPLRVAAEDYVVPPARRLPMRWDTGSPSPLRAQTRWRLECGCDTGAMTHDPFEIRLSEPRKEWIPSSI